jgi:hypothetical protein
MKRLVDDMLVLIWMGWISTIAWYYGTRWWS